jgi:hypothetical protein
MARSLADVDFMLVMGDDWQPAFSRAFFAPGFGLFD